MIGGGKKIGGRRGGWDEMGEREDEVGMGYGKEKGVRMKDMGMVKGEK